MATIKDIAKLAKVSTATVSRILNNDTSLSVSENTRKRVIKIAENLNYIPVKRRNKSAQTITKIGVIHWYSQKEELGDPYYVSITNGIEKECINKGIEIVTIFKNNDEYITSELNDLDGVIAIGKFSKEDVEKFSMYSPIIVFVDSSPDEKKYDSVVIDFKKAMREVLGYLLSKGHNNIGFIGGREYVGSKREPIEDERETAYIEFMRSKGLYDINNVYIGRFTPEDGYRLMREAIKKRQLPTAFFIASDSMAIGAFSALYEANINVPGDVSIVGFNDIPNSKFLIPSLSTVKVHTEFMGVTAVNLLLERLNDKRKISKKVVIPTELIIRESSK
ncbi:MULTISPECIES: LacI family DNA-binding transcriptional regulator [Clostridium]|uniref:HTH-type transcriptional regulator LacR n=2 Tax=Clostridium TaxID=1485 RepID=A0A151AKL1_9CLOT|nr:MULTISPECIES: LacI family DNA-binding transcriptional regulator [Clostridium]KYH28125.1 HTH-type transcriptional regulator LacR [Clostridium colicanis DSM 13634]MBE6043071.1 LacI family DNA-binding transcriptional regulator [Clostridium thermopalmarium]PRR70539.1 HTH-type transcriptional regulator LacR [Clostridium thermopalmarium DSM 5974]PVZ21273.1 LacI family transcriptional regulator [Clostridium thermopalmarium DSM 5974]